ncbi:pyridoxamine 5'-phosphate oxidase [Paracrocinitomix mangrovi]|uniref:pyridoxamine 5'-phosphate oxidase n=1 Tax=Paracrocinitomix mangrovi TaxID=2862509 RepID=UPI001C8ECDEC|nr:pyridoxamine 5'-phosphate oxidase [Paracrocinitomix mangrovi]UKN02580.1 pyridoxamine 5'-phosphate oxidase [Paracrocinitomix mangrovi]
MSSDNTGRYDFNKGKLEDFPFEDPMLFFSSWYQDSIEQGCADPQAVAISTVNADGKPSSRMVYMRNLLEEGIVIYTNYLSRKGGQISQNHNVALLFHWDCAERQVRIEGVAEKVDDSISDEYFAGRPRISQIGAWASEQSSEIDNRATLEERVKFFEEKYPDVVPRPPHWGGYLIKPSYFEFWQGRLGRLHDRLCYQKAEEGWRKFRIAP